MRMQRRRLPGLLAGLTLGALGAVDAARAACTIDPCIGGGTPIFDCDRDGLTDLEECSGLTIAGTPYPRCGSGECVDPRVSDLFVKFEKATNSAYTEFGISDAAAFGLITQPLTSGGLGMRVHVLPPNVSLPTTPQPNAITSRMSALVVREVRGTPISIPAQCNVTAALGAINGVTSVGGAGVAQIFTQRILDHVSCAYATNNQSPTSAAATADKINMIRHTTAHEATHANRLAPESVDRFGGHHYKTASGCVMDQASTYSTRGGVSFATPLKYCGPDQASVAAGETALGRIQCEDPSNVLDQDNFTIGCLPAQP
jgi:hypothetical protein